MAAWQSLEESFAGGLHLTQRPVAVTFLDAVPAGIARIDGSQPSGSCAPDYPLQVAVQSICISAGDQVYAHTHRPVFERFGNAQAHEQNCGAADSIMRKYQVAGAALN